jgi:hypothetical protein
VRTLGLLTLLVMLLAPAVARAQPVNVATLDDGTSAVTVTTGAEHGLMLGAGYVRAVAVADRALVLGGDLTLGWAEVDVDDFRVRAGALAPIVGRGRWRVLGGLAAIVRGTENDTARMIDVGADASVHAGWYTPRGLVALELGIDGALATHVAHSDAYRMYVYADARDGWYRTPGATLRAGVQGGVTVGRVDLILRAGRIHEASGEPAMFPFYGTLSIDTRW